MVIWEVQGLGQVVDGPCVICLLDRVMMLIDLSGRDQMDASGDRDGWLVAD